MKRSKILVEISDILLIDKTFGSSEIKLAEKILNKLEQSGMLPPEYSGFTESGHGQRHYSIRKWEPEND